MGLIPAECLVNHRSIVWDVLIANGAPAESYRDDCNRCLFSNAGDSRRLPPQGPCARILTSGFIVDEIWRRLLQRAGARPGLPLTDDPDLHLLVDGQRVDGAARDGTFAFQLPRVSSSARIVSRAGIPQELGLARDDRMLGVAVRRIEIAAARRTRTIYAHASSLMEGYHAYEPDNGLRWTDGDTAIPPELFKGMREPATLRLVTGARTRYLDDGRIGRAV